MNSIYGYICTYKDNNIYSEQEQINECKEYTNDNIKRFYIDRNIKTDHMSYRKEFNDLIDILNPYDSIIVMNKTILGNNILMHSCISDIKEDKKVKFVLIDELGKTGNLIVGSNIDENIIIHDVIDNEIREMIKHEYKIELNNFDNIYATKIKGIIHEKYKRNYNINDILYIIKN